MNHKYVYFIGVLLLGLFTVSPGWSQTKPETKGPVITHAFAADKGYYGYIWKIYIEAEDPNEDMLRIALVLDGSGRSRYPTDWIDLKPKYRKYFKGYIQWNTFSSKAGYPIEWTQITLRVSILDKRGNESNEVVFPFTFESGIPDPYEYKLPSPFDQGDLPRLGYVTIDITNHMGF
jgi:hypothetical protein